MSLTINKSIHKVDSDLYRDHLGFQTADGDADINFDHKANDVVAGLNDQQDDECILCDLFDADNYNHQKKHGKQQ